LKNNIRRKVSLPDPRVDHSEADLELRQTTA